LCLSARTIVTVATPLAPISTWTLSSGMLGNLPRSRRRPEKCSHRALKRPPEKTPGAVVESLADLAAVGPADVVRTQLQRYRDAGATDLVLSPLRGVEGDPQRLWDVAASL
jgi:hypothetical protein